MHIRSLGLAMVMVGALSGCGPEEDLSEGADPGEQSSEALSSWYCGTRCQGKPPSWVVPGHGKCSTGARLIGIGHPNASLAVDRGYPGFNANGITVRVYYSPKCQTLWAVVANSTQPVVSERQCDVNVSWIGVPGGTIWYECPHPGTTLTTAMVNDHSPTYGIAASANAHVTRGSGAQRRYAFFEYDY